MARTCSKLGTRSLYAKPYSPESKGFDLQCKIGHYDRSETNVYIECHLKYAGCDRPVFSEKAIEKIYRFFSGTVRLINKVCTYCLLYGAKMAMPSSTIAWPNESLKVSFHESIFRNGLWQGSGSMDRGDGGTPYGLHCGESIKIKVVLIAWVVDLRPDVNGTSLQKTYVSTQERYQVIL